MHIKRQYFCLKTKFWMSNFGMAQILTIYINKSNIQFSQEKVNKFTYLIYQIIQNYSENILPINTYKQIPNVG